jgi:hypothetical protein
MDIVLNLAILIGLLVLGVPVPFCFMAAVFSTFLMGNYSTMFIISTGFKQVNSMAVLAILFFILMGGLMGTGGIASRLVAISDSILGRKKHGLGTVTIISCAIFGAGISKGSGHGAGRLPVRSGSTHPPQRAHGALCMGHLAIGRRLFSIYGGSRNHHGMPLLFHECIYDP